jgi:hypothetical protein
MRATAAAALASTLFVGACGTAHHAGVNAPPSVTLEHVATTLPNVSGTIPLKVLSLAGPYNPLLSRDVFLQQLDQKRSANDLQRGRDGCSNLRAVAERDTIGSILDGIESRLQALEAASMLNNSSIQNGALVGRQSPLVGQHRLSMSIHGSQLVHSLE